MPTLDENYWDIQEGAGIKFFYAIPDIIKKIPITFRQRE